jgi:uncharacterized RmlC-like cupin family protein
MGQARPVVMRADRGPIAPCPPTSGMERREIMDRAQTWVGWARTEAGMAGGWHHHGDRDSYVYVVSGAVTMEYGPGGQEQVRGTTGDMIFNPARMVHRDTTRDEPAEFFLVRVGTGPLTVNVDAPDPS